MKQQNGLFCAVLSALLLILVSVPGSAQDFRGAITGTVSDATGGVLPGVTVTVTNVATNLASPTVTDERGFTRFATSSPAPTPSKRNSTDSRR